MSSNEVPGLINSDLVFGHLVKNKTLLTVYLEDGTTLSGTILGKDDVFLLITENTILHMVQINKVNRIQAEVNVDILVDLPSKSGSSKPKITPVFNEQSNLPPVASSAEDKPNKEQYKHRLDQLVRNW